MTIDPWHYPRTALAEQILGMFETGLSTALTFFAPRRMGKTEFLQKDIMPLAKNRNWQVFYFSFLAIGAAAANDFTKSLLDFAEQTRTLRKTRNLLRRVSSLSGGAGNIKARIEFRDPVQIQKDLQEVMTNLAARGKVLLLLDEIQVLAQDSVNAHFIAALRTALDVNKDNIKVIFTGSSQEGLRRMFSRAKAPFFHFGQNLTFPEFDRGFTDHLAHLFEKITQRKLDRNALWNIFQEMQKIPQFARTLIERLALNPQLSLEKAKNQLQAEIFTDREFVDHWEKNSALERLLLYEIITDAHALFSVETRIKLAKTLGVANLSVSTVQSALRTLLRKGFIGRHPEQSGYFIEDPNFKTWLLQKSNEQ